MIVINIGNKEYHVREAKTDEELQKGLKEVEKLPYNEGMLFYLPERQNQQTFTMEEMKIPLDIIFINQDCQVVFVSRNCQPGESDITNDPDNIDQGDYIAYVLEVNSNSGIQEGDVLDFGESQPTMKVLAQDGSTQMDLWGGERIFSRKNTIVLIRKAKKAELSNDDKDYRALGRYIFKCIKEQNQRPAEYVEMSK